MGVLIGIDAGSTKTSLTEYDEKGNRIGHAIGPAANFSVLGKEAGERIAKLVAPFVSNANGVVDYLAVGASGLRGSGLGPWFEKELSSRFSCPCRCVDDGVMAMKAFLGCEPGVLLISGTGSVAYGQKEEKVASIGGWGNLLGESGCGNSIALDALKRMTARHDSGLLPSSLDEALLDDLKLDSIFKVPSAVYGHEKAYISRLAKTVETEADQGNQEAKEILAKAGEELFVMADAMIRRLNLKKITVALSGSIICKCRYVYDAFANKMRALYPNCDIKMGEAEPEKAVFAFWREGR